MKVWKVIAHADTFTQPWKLPKETKELETRLQSDKKSWRNEQRAKCKRDKGKRNTYGWPWGLEDRDKGRKREGMAEAKKKKRNESKAAECLLISHFPPERWKRKKEGIRKEWAEKMNELEIWKTEWGGWGETQKRKTKQGGCNGKVRTEMPGKKGGQGRVWLH